MTETFTADRFTKLTTIDLRHFPDTDVIILCTRCMYFIGRKQNRFQPCERFTPSTVCESIKFRADHAWDNTGQVEMVMFRA